MLRIHFFSEKFHWLDILLFLYIGIVNILILVAVTSAWNMDVSLATVDASWHGEAASDFAGNFADIVGDVNRDGYEDIIIGAASNDQNGTSSGKAYLIFGSASNWSMDRSLGNASYVNASFIGEAAGDALGQTVNGIGDVNGDGYADFAIGARQNSEATSTAGQVYFIFGRASGWTLNQSVTTTASASFVGKDPADQISDEIDGLGDVNGDGLGDVIVCSNVDDEVYQNAGFCHLIFGKSSGWAMDQSIGTPGVVAQSYVGTGIENLLGTGIAGVGDINADGYADFAMGATGNDDGGTDRGHVYIVFGKANGWTGASSSVYTAADASFVGEQDSSFAGFNIAGLGDVNGDGIHDMAITASSYDNGGTVDVGKLYIVFGKRSGWAKDVSLSTSDASYIGENASDFLQKLAGGGDVNNDGYMDILVSAESNDAAASNAGQTYIIFGKGSGWSNNVSLANADGSFIGEAVASDVSGRRLSMGDVNGDGADDILTTAYANDEAGVNAGQIYLVLSQRPPTVSFITTSTATNGTGYVSVSATVSDANSYAQSLRVRYRAGSNCSGATTTAATLLSTVGVTYTDSSGVPTVSSTASFQIGNETGRKIITSSGANTVTFTWASATDAPTANGTYCLALTTTDGTAYSSIASTTLTIDNVAPTAPGALMVFSVNTTTIQTTFSTTTTETHFREYQILTATTTVPLSGTASAFTSTSDTNLGSITFASATSTVVTALTPNTAYYLNIIAFDRFGNSASSTRIVNTTTLAAVPVSLRESQKDQTSITVVWDGNNNPAGTEYYVENSTVNTNASWSTSTSWTSTHLSCRQAYTFRVKARNSALVETAVTSATIETAPCPTAPLVGGSSIPNMVNIVPTHGEATSSVPQEEDIRQSPIPSPRVLAPMNAENITTLPFVVRGTSEPGATVSVSIGESVYTVLSDARGIFSLTILDQLPPGEYVMKVWESMDGRKSGERSVRVRYIKEQTETSTTSERIVRKPSMPRLPPSDPVLPPVKQIQTVEESLDEVETHESFLLVVRPHTTDVYEEQVRTIETKSGEFVHIMIRPDRDVHSITARLYASSTARVSQAVTWKEHLRDLFTLRPVYAETMPTAWLSGYVFSPLPVSRVYASTVTLSDLRPGTYRLAVSINGIDGSRTHIMKTIQVNAKGVVYAGTNTADHRVRDAKLTLYHQDETGAFSVWKGERFQERNPKLSDVDGTYSFSVPQGRYYVSVLVQGYEEYTSGIIVVSSTGFIDQDISLTKKATESWWQHFWMWVGHRIAG